MDKNIKEKLKSIIGGVIPKKYPYWLLLSNGNFLVLEEAAASKQHDIKKWAIELLKELEEYKLTVFTYLEDIIHVTEYSGWIVTNRFGAYTFVHESEFLEKDPSELAISVKGCFKFMEDCSSKEIIYINTPQNQVSKQF